MTLRGILLPAFVVVTGIVIAILSATALREDARQSWQKVADQTAQSLSGTLFGWFEESYAPISGVAALVENSSDVTETEFLGAYDGLEARASAFFLDAIALITQVSSEETAGWLVRYSTDSMGALEQEGDLTDHPEILNAVNVANSRMGEFILGSPIAGKDVASTSLPVALAVSSENGISVVVGLINYDSVLSGLFRLHVPVGLQIEIRGKFPQLASQGAVQNVISSGKNQPLYSTSNRTVSAGAELSMIWHFDKTFSGGPAEELAEVTLASGITISVILTLFVAAMIQRDQTITRQVEAATRELSEKETQLRLALDNMPGAMWVVDQDLKLVFANKQYVEYYGDPGNIVVAGSSMVDILKQEIGSNLLGIKGSGVGVLEQRIASYKSNSVSAFEDRTHNGGFIHVTRKPMPGGLVISVATDVTERKNAEIADQQSRDMLEAMFASTPVPLVVRSVDQPTYQKVNKAACELIGLTEEEFLRLDPKNIWYDQAERQAFLKTLDENGRSEDIEVKARHFPSKGYRDVVVTTAPVNYEGAPGLLMAALDISERKRTEGEIKKAHRLIQESVNYASNIQRSLLPSLSYLCEDLNDVTVIWEPRDTVGGDLYWYRRYRDGVLLILGDCTGHGIPGAFITLIATGALDRSVREYQNADPAALLQAMNRSMKITLGQTEAKGASDDGMDIGICYINTREPSLTFAGAKLSLFSFNNGEYQEMKGDKSSIGYRGVDFDRKFTNHYVPVEKSTSYVMASDGIFDQVGGERRRSFGKKRFARSILENVHLDLTNQGERLMSALNEYQGGELRRDDISLIGFKI